MKEKIEHLIELIKFHSYDNEIAHQEYDRLLEEFILNYDKSLLPEITELIKIEKSFWYA